jgi:hypothetical protein
VLAALDRVGLDAEQPSRPETVPSTRSRRRSGSLAVLCGGGVNDFRSESESPALDPGV